MADGGKVIIKIDGDNKGFKSAMNKVGDIAKTAAKGIAVGVGAASAAIGAIGTQAVKAYADYQQLTGGVETLFKDSANVVQSYANQAYQTAGMSANQYMETVTSFSASLLQSLGGDTAKAAEYGNQAVIDMSDNANKMGTSIEMIQNAYQGFAKQNYTMLDNLKLGYGGTQEEMKRLIKDASNMKDVQKELGITVDANSMSFANIVNAISVMQTSMGIAGTTSKEAATTIQGSLGMLQASWENLLTGLADPNADIDLLIDNVINSVMTLGQNLEPVIQAVLDKIPIMIDTLGTVIIQKLPEIINSILPSLMSSAGQLIMTLSNSIIDNLPMLMNTAVTVILTFVQGLSDSLPELIPAAYDMILQIIDGIVDNLDLIIEAALELIIALAEGLIAALPKLAEKVPEIIVKIVATIIKEAPKMLQASIKLISELWNGLINAYKTYFASWGTQIYNYIIKPIADKVKDMLDIGRNMVAGIWNGFKEKFSGMINKIKGLIDLIPESIKKVLGIHSPSTVMRDEVGKMITAGIAVGIEKATPSLEEAIKNQKQTIVDNYKEIAQAAIDSIDEVAKSEDNFAKKLKDFGSLYTTNKITFGDKETEFIGLADISSQTQAIERYTDLLLKVKARGNVTQEFFSQLRDMSIDEGTKFAEALLAVNDDTFNQYMQDWQAKQAATSELSKMVYADEAEQAKDEIQTSFENFDTDLEEQGKQNAQSWGQGFIEQIKQLMPNIMGMINSAFSGIVTGNQLAYAGAGASNSYSSTYYIQAAEGESMQKQLWSLKNAEFLKKQRGY